MSFSLATPEIFLLSATCFILLLDVFLKDKFRSIGYWASLLALGVTLVLTYQSWTEAKALAFNGMFVHDTLSVVLKMAVLSIVTAIFVYSKPYLIDRKIFKGEFYSISLFATLGMMVMISANTLLMLYMGLELLSLSMYALVAFNRDNGRCTEAAMKYFVLGAIASGMLLYGMSLLYGLSGSIELSSIAEYVANQKIMSSVALLFALTFIIVGLGFKFGVAPFHMWVPDVYQGAPTPVTMMLASAPKIAVFAMTMRLLVGGMEFGSEGWQQMLIPLIVMSMVIGNIAAIAQTNLKRMLAYSTISHMGFVLLGFVSASEGGYSAAMYYAITYAITALGGFAILIALSHEDGDAEELDDLRGLSRRHPWYAFMMMLFLFSMAGVPPLVGFFAKLYILQAVVSAGFVWLAVIAVLMSVVGAFYYLRAIKLMYFDKPIDERSISMSISFNALLSVNGLLVVALGLTPSLMALCLIAIKQSI
ncbi:MAG: NADH-quinone oxidoreductase subunit NuoN [Thiotrichaceae bacterium]|nr:NADH-quinone oxidoreductase subunit NuoN [Thiotrichaceae bacterium]